jgi:UDP-4-amino-4-deoxy-L-arabinose formyltransferase/UDP-glucuronic acid dehydrogenase (UDP-4-keto-hexauronic acid decarboxylating)
LISLLPPSRSGEDGKALKVLLVGEEAAAIQLLKYLAASCHRIAGVLASPPDARRGVGTLWQVAEKLGCEVWPSKLVKDPAFGRVLRSVEADILLNVHSLYIIREEILEAPKLGSFNLHPGPLPHYSGLNTVSWALYSGAREYGVTLHKMAPEIDAGPIAYQASFPIDGGDTALSLYGKCVRKGLPLVKALLAQAARDPDGIPSIAQDLSRRRYFGRQVPHHGEFSWSWPARRLVNFVRACDYSPFPSPWGHPRGVLAGAEVALLKTELTGLDCDVPPGTVRKTAGSEIRVACGDEWISVSKMMIEGKPCAAAELLLRPRDRAEAPQAACSPDS